MQEEGDRAREQPQLGSCIPHPGHISTSDMSRERMQAQALPCPIHLRMLLHILTYPGPDTLAALGQLGWALVGRESFPAWLGQGRVLHQ